MSAGDWKERFTRLRVSTSGFLWKIINDWSFSLSSLIAYYLLISLLPILLSIFSVTVIFFGNNEEIVNRTITRLTQSFPNEEFNQLMLSLARSVSKQALTVLVISFLISIFAASRLFVGIDDVLTIIYRTRERTILQQNIHAIRMLLIFVLLMPIIIISASAPAILKQNQQVYHFMMTICSGLFVFLLIGLIFYFVPKPKMRLSRVWCGSLFASVGFLVVMELFPVYVKLLMTDYVGQMGFIIIVLILFYVVSLLFVLGAQINAYFFDHIQPLRVSLGNILYEHSDQENTRLIENDGNMSTLMDGFSPLH